MRTNRPLSVKRQAGNIMIQSAIGLGVMGVVQVGLSNHALSVAYEAKGTAIGTQLDNVRANLDSYVATYYGTLTSPSPTVTGVANPMAPTIAELQGLGLPRTSTVTAPVAGGNYRMQITKSPASCTGGACNLRARIWLDQPILDANNAPDLNILGAAVKASSGAMSFSLPDTPTQISSSSGWVEVNPDATSRAGILMAVTGYDSSAMAAMIRRDGARTATASHDWGGFNITNMGTAQAGTMQATNNISAGGNVAAGGAVTGGTVTASGNVQGGAVSSTGEVWTNGWYRSNTPGTGWYSQAHGVGIYAYDNAWVRTYNNAGLQTNGQVNAGSVLAHNGVISYGVNRGYGPVVNTANDWAILGYDGAGNANAQPTVHVGSAYLNDAYIRSVGKWVSQIANQGGGVTLGRGAYGDSYLMSGECSPDGSLCNYGGRMNGLFKDASGNLWLASTVTRN